MTENNKTDLRPQSPISWYPGHMAKAQRLIEVERGLLDFVYEVVDARIPYASKLNDLDDVLRDKPRVLIMTKADLCDIEMTKKWVTYYEDKGYKVILMNLLRQPNLTKLDQITKEGLGEKVLKLKRPLRGLVIGVPNVGKSTLINVLTGMKKAPVQNRPGVTRGLNWYQVNSKLYLMDSPGLLWPKLEDNNLTYNLMAFMSIKLELVPLLEVSTYILEVMLKYYPKALERCYQVEGVRFEDLYDVIGQKRGALLKGGAIDYDQVAKLIINDLNRGKLGLVTFDIRR